MIIGIDARILGSKFGGIVEYSEKLISEMIARAPEHQYKLFYSSFRRSFPKYSWLEKPNVKVYKFWIPNNLLFATNRIFGWPHLDSLMGGVDVFFSPHFFIASLSSKSSRVTTFHDLSFKRFKEFFTLGKRFWHTIQMNPSSQARFSDRVIAVSESTKQDLVKYYNIDPSHISVIYSGVSVSKLTEKELLEFKNIHRLPDRYILSLSTLEPRKNIEGIIKAFDILKSMPSFDDVELVIIGGAGWRHKPIIKAIESSPFKSQIRYMGFVPSFDRAGYYGNASVFVYPSFFEGFGFPVLEAMACGTPVLTSLNSSLPEVGEDAAIYINPYSIMDIAEGMNILLTDSSIRSQCIRKGLAQSIKFSWQNCAQKTLEIITRLS